MAYSADRLNVQELIRRPGVAAWPHHAIWLPAQRQTVSEIAAVTGFLPAARSDWPAATTSLASIRWVTAAAATARRRGF